MPTWVPTPLFNPHYLGLDLLSYGHLGALGIGLPWTIFVLTIHVVWSIATPIALVEGIWPGRDRWFGRVGLGVVIGVLVLGALAIAGVSWSSSGFIAAPGQLVAAALLALVVAAVAFRLPRVERSRPPRAVLPATAVAVALASAFQLMEHAGPQLVPAWATVIVLLLLPAATVTIAVRCQLDVLGLAVGAVLTYAWVGLANSASAGLAGAIEQIVLVLVAIAVSALAVVRRTRLSVLDGLSVSGGENSVSATGSDADAEAHARRR